MREIQFRGKRFDNGKWVYGDLLHIAGGCLIYFGSQTETGPDIPEDSDIAVGLGLDEIAVVDPSTVGQLTWLYDRNCKKIYEGDLLECPNVPTIPLEVYYNSEYGSFCLAEHTHTEGVLKGSTPIGEMLMHYPGMHIIGNIHDNSNLLPSNCKS